MFKGTIRLKQHDPTVVRPKQACRDASRECREDVKLERSPGLNLVRVERSSLCIIAYVKKKKTDRESKQNADMKTNISRSKSKRVSSVSSLNMIDEYSRSEPTMEIELAYEESRGYWKHYSPGKWFKQAKAVGKINNVKATMLFDSGAEVSIIDTTFARNVGCIDEVKNVSGSEKLRI